MKLSIWFKVSQIIVAAFVMAQAFTQETVRVPLLSACNRSRHGPVRVHRRRKQRTESLPGCFTGALLFGRHDAFMVRTF
jgi:hypothetical protein